MTPLRSGTSGQGENYSNRPHAELNQKQEKKLEEKRNRFPEGKLEKSFKKGKHQYFGRQKKSKRGEKRHHR